MTKSKQKTDDIHDRVFIITDMCMYENNRKNGTYHPHAIEVVDTETGQTRYIQSGAKIRFVAGNITADRNQDTYNKINHKKKTKNNDTKPNNHAGGSAQRGGNGGAGGNQ